MSISAYVYAAGFSQEQMENDWTQGDPTELSIPAPEDAETNALGSEQPMSSQEDISYAIQMTETILEPEHNLETFGATVIDYNIVTELMDEVGKVRIRQGRLHVERPQVITPTYYANQLLENFGDEASEYAEWLRKTQEGLRILQYGLRFRKEEAQEQIVEGHIEEVAEKIAEEEKEEGKNFSGVLIGIDDMWEVSLLKFASEVIQGSAQTHFRELSKHGLLEGTSNDVPNAVRVEIESEFRNAQGDRDRIHALGNKLRQYGILEEYEDRFFELVKQLRQ